MSYQSWHDYGLGINFTDFEIACNRADDPITVEDIERLLKVAPKLQRDVHEYIEGVKEDNPDVEIEVDDYRCFDPDGYGLELAYIFAQAVSEAEGLTHLYATSSYENDHFVLFGQGYPWNLNEREKAITKEEVEGIFYKYLKILKPSLGETVDAEIDFQSVENGG